MQIYPSVRLWRAQLALHCLSGALLVWALMPWVVHQGHWLVLLLVALSGLAVSLLCLRAKRDESAGVLSLTETGWCWASNRLCCDLELHGELVVWPGLVILPFKECRGRRRKTLVLLSDSLAAEDLRRLRVWLRTVLPRL